MLPFLFATAVIAADADEIPTYEETLPDTPSWGTAKKRMYGQVFHDHATTFYCGCTFEGKVPDLTSCGMAESAVSSRAERVEVEHVVPASAFGRTRPCWAVGGREACLRDDPIFKVFHSDLHNLVPAVGFVNAVRSDYSMGLIAGDKARVGDCDFEVDNEDDKVEPPVEVRGDVARMYFYVEWVYGLPLSDGQRHLFLAWHQADPVDEWELERDRRIEGQQGNYNPFVR